MLEALINRALIVALFIAMLTVIRHTYFFIQAFLTSTEEEPVKYKLQSRPLFLLALSIAYIISVCFTGVKL